MPERSCMRPPLLCAAALATPAVCALPLVAVETAALAVMLAGCPLEKLVQPVAHILSVMAADIFRPI